MKKSIPAILSLVILVSCLLTACGSPSPSESPSTSPSVSPTESATPSVSPSTDPSTGASTSPSIDPIEPSISASASPSAEPTISASPSPSNKPKPSPSEKPSPTPSASPSPSLTPRPSPIDEPSPSPSIEPSIEPSPSTDANLAETSPLTDIMAAILTDAELPRVIETELTSDLFKAYLFIDPIDGAEALSSDAMMSSVAHSVVLLRVPKGSDAEAIAADIEKNANPLKWVCVSAKKVVVKSTGNLILLVMSSEANADIIAKNFEEKI